ncbi:ATP-binding protein [Paraburkholderia sp. 35.1]|uniref:ATP-binding protein n=1 Tax=Paraburkholderia sp. 35.1 TaxID=2991058 RepID=UPI003D21A8DF
MNAAYDAGRIALMLNELRLPTIGRLWPDFAERSDKESWQASRLLGALLEHELAERAKRRIERHRAESHLDPTKTLATFDFGVVPMVSKAHVMALATGDSWLEKGATILLFGPPGTVWRRFEVQLEIPKPDFPVRMEIARTFMTPLTPPESHLRLIAWFTEGASGAEIEMLVRTYKKATIVNAESERGLLDTLQQFATRNAARVEESRRALLFAEPGTLFRAMKSDPRASAAARPSTARAGATPRPSARPLPAPLSNWPECLTLSPARAACRAQAVSPRRTAPRRFAPPRS